MTPRDPDDSKKKRRSDSDSSDENLKDKSEKITKSIMPKLLTQARQMFKEHLEHYATMIHCDRLRAQMNIQITQAQFEMKNDIDVQGHTIN